MSRLVAQSRHAQCGDKCPILGAKRTLRRGVDAVAIQLIRSGRVPALRLIYFLSVMLGGGLWMFVSALSLAHLCRFFDTLAALSIPHAASLLAIGFSQG